MPRRRGVAISEMALPLVANAHQLWTTVALDAHVVEWSDAGANRLRPPTGAPAPMRGAEPFR